MNSSLSTCNPSARPKLAPRPSRGLLKANHIQGPLGEFEPVAGSALFMSQARSSNVHSISGRQTSRRADRLRRPQIRSRLHHREHALGAGWSPLRQPDILREGLFGGTISTAWPLLDLKPAGEAKYEGVKKIDGRELHDLTYVPNKSSSGSDLTIHLYFEPDTFRT